MSTLNPFPDSKDVAIVICIGDRQLSTQWSVVPRIGEVIHGYSLGTRLFSGRVIGIEHHFDIDRPTINVRLPSGSFL